MTLFTPDQLAVALAALGINGNCSMQFQLSLRSPNIKIILHLHNELAVVLQNLRSNVTHLVTGISRACYFHYPTQATTLTAFDEAVQAGVVEILYVYIPPTLVLPYLPPSNVILLSAVSFLEESLKWKLNQGNNVSGMRFLYWTILEHSNLEISKSLLSLCTKVNSTLPRGARNFVRRQEWIPMEQHIIKKYTPI
ncbi:hypothetical protein IW262DRAFT_1297792 [Armillaria fumosa]|nr:hypothetical protein IW262DRAFT_1297792 [Armillaria fumosa]